MKLLSIHSILWPSLLVLWTAQNETEATNPEVCQDEKYPSDLQLLTSSEHIVEKAAVLDNFRCLHYPTNVLNCSWTFDILQNESQLSVYLSICDDKRAVNSLNRSSAERAGSLSLILRNDEKLYVILQFNITLHNHWTVYTYTETTDMLEVLSPPENISASVKDGDLLVTWSLPSSKLDSKHCFEYQLDLGDQERPKDLPPTEELSHTEKNIDPSFTYRIRLRTRKDFICQENSEWSEWSHVVTLEQSNYKLNTLVIISISLGIPMILLAVLLFVRYQRVSEILFPPIPHPPPKYIHFLQKNDPFNFFHPAQSTEPVEEITEVEDTEQNPGKTF